MRTLDEQKSYWVRQLADRPAAIELPLDKERPPVCSFIRETEWILIEADLLEKLKGLASKEGVSPLAILLAAFQALLFRHTGQTDLVIGTLLEADEAGVRRLIPLRMQVSGDSSAKDFIHQGSNAVKDAAENGDYRLSAMVEMGNPELNGSSPPLFNSAFIYLDSSSADSQRGLPDSLAPGFADYLAQADTVFGARDEKSGLSVNCDCDAEIFEASTIATLLGHFQILLRGIISDPLCKLSNLPLLTAAETRKLLVEWNETRSDFPQNACVHQLFETQAERNPDAVAVVFEKEQLTYRELNARANRLAAHLSGIGVGPEALVGICVERSLEMIVGLLGILKAGGAYVPLDPDYPQERLAYMISDSKMSVLLTQTRLLSNLPHHQAQVVCLDAFDSQVTEGTSSAALRVPSSDNLAYVIYTSGSTGKPKGVMVTHRNVVNFFTGMDQAVGGEPPGVWLAVTSISFDISVLELLWTLARGFKVVIYKEDRGQAVHPVQSGALRGEIDFSLFYFASDEGQDAGERYRLLLEGARFADRNGFAAVWTPERHFHAFGGLYPNPSVTSAAVAAITERVNIRAGSVVLPLQNPIRVAEEWSVVDNLSKGRVGISFASGWQVNDFVLSPENYAVRKEVMLREIETVRKLWRGETLLFPGAEGKEVPIRILPRPVQRELPIWITATGNPETFKMAGRLGANLLTHLIGQKIEDLAEKITLYRQAWRESGHVGEGRVTLMLHTFVGEDLDAVRETVRKPFSNYLRSSVDLLKNSPWGFAPARMGAKSQLRKLSSEPVNLAEDELSALLEHAFDRYFENSSLFGTTEVCLRMVGQVKNIGVDEIACLIDFGVETQQVIDSLRLLNQVREQSNGTPPSAHDDYSLAALIGRHQVTHLQCTPSMAGMLISQPESRAALGTLRKLMIGGEALPPGLARQLREVVSGTIHNMYGPTETTVWSTTQQIGAMEDSVTIGRPIANTEVYLLDSQLQLVPIGTPGELCIGGAGVVRGYLNRPDLTVHKFVPNPFRQEGSSRLYRTGDLARYRRDGTIRFLGRIDHQVKIRGYRIELGEIEAVLNEHPTVGGAVVIAREDVPGDQRLVAYVTARDGKAPDERDLRNYLKEKLPGYMVPAHVVHVDAFPQTPNRKIDRKALPVPDQERTDSEVVFEPPRTAVEEVVAEIWAGLLGTEQVGVKDNFFELGGHSLLATQAVTRLREVFQIELPVGSLFAAPTVASLAAFMIAHEPRAGLIEKTAIILKRIAVMSEDEISEKLGPSRAY